MLAWTWPKVEGPLPVPYDVQLNGIASRMKAGNIVEFESTLIKNPVNGKEVAPPHDPARGHHRERGGPGMLEGVSCRPGSADGSFGSVHGRRAL